jgi:hypothetical protein
MVEAILLYVLLQTSRVVIQIKLSNVSFKIKYKNKRMTQNTCLVLLYLFARTKKKLIGHMCSQGKAKLKACLKMP